MLLHSADIQFIDVIDWVKAQIIAEHGEVPDDLEIRIKCQLSELLCVDINDITSESWLVQELGME